MKRFTFHEGIVAPLDRANVDTDAIIPKQFLRSIKRTGFGDNLFDAWRYLDTGYPGQDHARRPRNPDFVLNQPPYRNASILLTHRNFGCGSSREHAPWALEQSGFRAIVAPSFADIFYNNCFKNGLLPIVLSESQVDHLFDMVKGFPGMSLTIDLESQTIGTSNRAVTYAFEVGPFRKYCLLNGLDEIGLTLLQSEKIRAFEARRLAAQPWLSNTIDAGRSANVIRVSSARA